MTHPDVKIRTALHEAGVEAITAYRRRHAEPEPEPEQPEQPETDGPIPPDPDQGAGNRYRPRPKIDMNIMIREAAGIDTHRRPGRRVPPY